MTSTAPTWEAVCGHRRIVVPEGTALPFQRLRRCGDTTTNGPDLVVSLAPDSEPDPEEVVWVGGASGEKIRDMFPAISAEGGLVRTFERDGHAVLVARTPSGEYEVAPLLPHDFTEDERLSLYAIVYQRSQRERDKTLPVPVQAGALQLLAAGGRTAALRGEGLAQRVEVKTERKVRNGRGTDLVAVSIRPPRGVRCQALQVRCEEPLLPGLAAAPRSELPMLVGEALGRTVGPRGLQTILAGMALVLKQQVVELDPETGKVPDAFRCEVMRIMGMPSREASQRQRAVVDDALQFLVHAELEVAPVGRKSRPTEYVPLLARSSHLDAEPGAERRPYRLHVNPLVLPEAQDGHRWRVPEALFQVSDDADRDGVVRLMGFQLAYRLGMGTIGHENLRKFLQRAGLWEWAVKADKTQRGGYALRVIRKALDELRALPWIDEAPADIAGGTIIAGDKIEDATIRYREPPAWSRSSK